MRFKMEIDHEIEAMESVSTLEKLLENCRHISGFIEEDILDEALPKHLNSYIDITIQSDEFRAKIPFFPELSREKAENLFNRLESERKKLSKRLSSKKKSLKNKFASEYDSLLATNPNPEELDGLDDVARAYLFLKESKGTFLGKYFNDPIQEYVEIKKELEPVYANLKKIVEKHNNSEFTEKAQLKTALGEIKTVLKEYHAIKDDDELLDKAYKDISVGLRERLEYQLKNVKQLSQAREEITQDLAKIERYMGDKNIRQMREAVKISHHKYAEEDSLRNLAEEYSSLRKKAKEMMRTHDAEIAKKKIEEEERKFAQAFRKEEERNEYQKLANEATSQRIAEERHKQLGYKNKLLKDEIRRNEEEISKYQSTIDDFKSRIEDIHQRNEIDSELTAREFALKARELEFYQREINEKEARVQELKSEKQETISALHLAIGELSESLERKDEQLISERVSHKKEVEGIHTKVNTLFHKLKNKELDEKERKKEEYWNSRNHLTDEILYPARGPFLDDVRYYIQEDHPLIKFIVEDQNLKKETYNETAYACMMFTKKRMIYTSDEKIASLPEFWQKPSHMLQIAAAKEASGEDPRMEGDCEDGTNLMVSLMIAAGIPSYKVRNACGEVPGGGHSWTTYLRENEDGTDEWVILDWTDMPNNKSIEERIPAKDRPEYQKIHFSFNNEHSWDHTQGNLEKVINPEVKETIVEVYETPKRIEDSRENKKEKRSYAPKVSLREFSLALHLNEIGLPSNTWYFRFRRILKSSLGNKDNWIQRFTRLSNYVSKLEPSPEQEDMEYIMGLRNGLEKAVKTDYISRTIPENKMYVVENMFNQIDNYFEKCKGLSEMKTAV